MYKLNDLKRSFLNSKKRRQKQQRSRQGKEGVDEGRRSFNRLFQSHILPKNFCPARELRMHVIPHPVHANEATHTQFARGRRSNMATLNYRHIGRLLHRLHFCRSYSTRFSVSVFFNSQTSIILVSLCSSFVSKAAVSSQWNSMQCKQLTKCR